jgi:hypothetical protein
VPCAHSGLPPELVPLDALLARWAQWARRQLTLVGWPPVSLTAKMIEWHELGLEREKLYPPGKTDKAPEGVMFIDSTVAKLPKRLREVIYTEYFSSAPSEQKAQRLGIKRALYRERIRSAQWLIYGKIEAELEL